MKKLKGETLLRLMALVMLTAQGSARAEVCHSECGQYIEGRCVKYVERCTDDNALPSPRYGAIAYDRHSGAYGYSYNWESRIKAEAVAMRNCEQQGSDCEVMVWFDRQCGAVAANGDGGAAYWGLGDTKNAAKAAALRKCERAHGERCEVKVARCSP